jgi:hypothetical protein
MPGNDRTIAPSRHRVTARVAPARGIAGQGVERGQEKGTAKKRGHPRFALPDGKCLVGLVTCHALVESPRAGWYTMFSTAATVGAGCFSSLKIMMHSLIGNLILRGRMGGEGFGERG